MMLNCVRKILSTNVKPGISEILLEGLKKKIELEQKFLDDLKKELKVKSEKWDMNSIFNKGIVHT